MAENIEKYLRLIETLNKVGVALSVEKNHARLLEMILSSAMDLTHADGGTLYLIYKKTLSFAFIANKTLHIKPMRAIESDLPITSIALYVNGQPNLNNVASYCFHKNKTINIADVYQAEGFDFSNTQYVDKRLGYRSKSFLTIPLSNHSNKIMGVLQLINAIDEDTGAIIPFTKETVLVAESLASQASITLINQELIQSQKKLFEAFLQLIAKAIDEKSNYTSNHCSRVPILTIMIANAMNRSVTGPLKDYHLTKDQFDELIIAAWLHDCGKIVTPEYIMNKATKLETLCDRIELINARFEIIKRDICITHLEQLLAANMSSKLTIENKYQKQINSLNQSQEFLKKINQGGEFLSEKDREKIRLLAKKYSYLEGNHKMSLLSDDDVLNLCISRGTLNDKEREIIQNHVQVTLTMLQVLPYPEHLKNVPEIAGSHHERVDGKGYPRGLSKEQMSIQTRILAIADIFEALTSADRPYKTAKTLKEVLHIMQDMKNNGHIDPDLYDLFVNEKIYLSYAKEYLNPEQIDAW